MLTLLLSAALCAPISMQDRTPSYAVVREQFELYSSSEPNSSERAAATEAIVKHLPDCRAEMFEVFAQDAFVAPARSLRSAERVLLIEVLAVPDPAELFGFLRGRARGEMPLPERLAAFELISAYAGRREMTLCVDLVQEQEALTSRERRQLTRTYEQSLSALTTRDDAGLGKFSRLWRKIPDEFLTPSLRVLGKSRSELAVEPLTSALWNEPRAASTALAELGRLASSLSGEERIQLVENIKFMGEHENPAARSALTRAFLALQRTEAVPTLVKLLDDDDATVVESAHRALTSLTGITLRPNGDRWRAWIKSQENWFLEQAPDLLLQLQSPLGHEVQSALRQLALHPYFSERVAPDILELLNHDSETVRAQACHALGACRVRSALPQLVQTLRHDEETVWPAAWSALKRITGKNLPSAYDLWEDLLRESSRAGS